MKLRDLLKDVSARTLRGAARRLGFGAPLLTVRRAAVPMGGLADESLAMAMLGQLAEGPSSTP